MTATELDDYVREHAVRLGQAMPADFSRCNGFVYHDGKHICPQHDRCLRFCSPPVPQANQNWIMVSGPDQLGDCSEFVPLE